MENGANMISKIFKQRPNIFRQQMIDKDDALFEEVVPGL